MSNYSFEILSSTFAGYFRATTLAFEEFSWRIHFWLRFPEFKTENPEGLLETENNRRREKKGEFLCGSLRSSVPSVLSFSEFNT